jgi:hypothetical protein
MIKAHIFRNGKHELTRTFKYLDKVKEVHDYFIQEYGQNLGNTFTADKKIVWNFESGHEVTLTGNIRTALGFRTPKN